MWSNLWHTVFFDPIYNGLIFIVGHVPHADVGVAIIILTIVVKVILFPLSIKAAETQYKMRFIESELKELKERFKDKREELARATMAAYKKAGINPLASVALALIQIPVIIALYLSVYSGGGVRLPEINTALLYSFVPVPDSLSMHFLGAFDIASRSIILAVLAGVSQFFSGYLSLPPIKKQDKDAKPDFKEDFARSMNIQMKYAMPLLIAFISYQISATIALYFIVSNVVTIVQEFILRAKLPDRHKSVTDIQTPA